MQGNHKMILQDFKNTHTIVIVAPEITKLMELTKFYTLHKCCLKQYLTMGLLKYLCAYSFVLSLL